MRLATAAIVAVVAVCVAACSAAVDAAFFSDIADAQVPPPSPVPPTPSGSGGAASLAQQMIAALNARDIDAISALFADDATVFDSTWGKDAVNKSTALFYLKQYFREAAAISDSFVPVVSLKRVVAGYFVLNDVVPQARASGTFYHATKAHAIIMSTANGQLIEHLARICSPTPGSLAPNATRTVARIRSLYEAVSQMNVKKVMTFFSPYAVAQTIPFTHNCNVTCIAKGMSNLFAGVSGGRLLMTGDEAPEYVGDEVAAVYVQLFAVLRGGVPAVRNAMHIFEYDAIGLIRVMTSVEN